MKMRTHCPINFTIEHFGDKWSYLIIRDLMFKGKRHYNEFLESEEKISTSVLGDRLRMLEASGIISKQEDDVKKSRIKYSLTKKGIELLPILVEMIIWAGTFDNQTAVEKDFLTRATQNKAILIAQIKEKILAEHLAQ
jgi:DNA-binding HxlR family transcriptional regulator